MFWQHYTKRTELLRTSPPSPTHLKTNLFEGIFLRFNRNAALTLKNYNYLHKFIFKFFCCCWVPDRMEIWVIHHWSTRVFGGTHWKIKTKNILIMCSNCLVKPGRFRLTWDQAQFKRFSYILSNGCHWNWACPPECFTKRNENRAWSQVRFRYHETEVLSFIRILT